MTPPFTISNEMIELISDISLLTGEVRIKSGLSDSLTLRRNCRISTVYSTLLIEGNRLSEGQVADIVNGKTVIAPPKDIAEVKNAYEIYEHLDSLDPYSVNDLLTAHGVLMRGLLSDAGEFRTQNVGVADRESGEIIHFGTLPLYVGSSVEALLEWGRESDTHPLIKSAVMHYELEQIHPFSDGNGRIGRLWHTLILSKWIELFAWLPVETIIHNHQSEYYKAIADSNNAANSDEFILFMLATVKEALTSV